MYLRRSDLLVAISGVLTFLIVRPLGRLFGSEILAIANVFSLKYKLIFKIKPFRRLVLGWFAIFFSFILSDLYNFGLSTGYINDFYEINDLASFFKWLGTVFRGWASVIFAIITTLFLTNYFVKSERSPWLYLLGLVLGGLIFGDSIDIGLQQENSNYFKANLMNTANPLIYLISYFIWKKSSKLTIVFLLVVGFFYILLDARSAGMSFFMGAGLLIVYLMPVKPKLSSLLFPLMLLMITAYSGYAYYVNQVLNHGFGGENSKQILSSESPYNPISLLKEGRGGFFIAYKAVLEKPVTGYGTWGEAEVDGQVLFSAIAGNFAQSQRGSAYSNGTVMIHSVFLQVWIWGGLLGLLGLLVILWEVVRLFMLIFTTNSTFMPVICVVLVMMFWHVFFSPILSMRKFFPFYISLVVSQYYFLFLKNKLKIN